VLADGKVVGAHLRGRLGQYAAGASLALVGHRHRAGDSQRDEQPRANAGRGEGEVSSGVGEGESEEVCLNSPRESKAPHSPFHTCGNGVAGHLGIDGAQAGYHAASHPRQLRIHERAVIFERDNFEVLLLLLMIFSPTGGTIQAPAVSANFLVSHL
jgi:hypothetical protein